MRTLKFMVNAQTITKDPNCNFTGLAAGTEGYLQAEFLFSAEWRGCRTAAVFTCLQKDYAAPIIHGKCEIPKEALIGDSFHVRAVGEKDGYRITTNKIRVTQERW